MRELLSRLGVWTIESSGPKQVRLSNDLPFIGTMTISTDQFVNSTAWTPA